MTTDTTRIAIAKDYLALTKPRITWLIVVTTAVGYFFGAKHGPWDAATIVRLAHTLTGTALLASATAVLNEWYERESDAKMRYVPSAALPAGRINPTGALIFGIVLAVLGVASCETGRQSENNDHWFYDHSRLSLCIYAAETGLSALHNCSGICGRYAAADRTRGGKWKLERGSMVSRRDSFRMCVPHSLAIAWMYRDDYARAGIRMLPVIKPDGKIDHPAHRCTFCVNVDSVSLFPVLLGMTGQIYFVGALVLGGCFLYYGIRVAMERTNIRARQVLLASVVYLPVIMVLLVIDRRGL